MGASTRGLKRAELRQLAEAAPPALIEGSKLRCPGCEEQFDILAFVPLKRSTKYEAHVVTVLKCPSRQCRHVFALKPHGPEEDS